VEAGSNTSTVGLRVVGGDEKEPSAWGYNRATLFLGDINTRTWPSRLGESQIRDSKNVVMSPAGLGPENDCAGEAQKKLYTTYSSSRQKGCYIRTITESVQLENKITGRESQGACRVHNGESPVRIERILGSHGRRVRLKINCELL
jgi:hypothetical protein